MTMRACVFQKTRAASGSIVASGRFYGSWLGVVPSAMGPRSFVMAKPLVGPGVCVLTELSAQALTQDSLTLHGRLLKTTLSRSCPCPRPDAHRPFCLTTHSSQPTGLRLRPPAHRRLYIHCPVPGAASHRRCCPRIPRPPPPFANHQVRPSRVHQRQAGATTPPLLL
jgi:hypothetical protein